MYWVPALKSQMQHLEILVISLLIVMTLVVMLFWVSLGVFGGLTCLLLSMIFIYRPLTDLDPYYYSVLILAFFLNCFLGYYIHRNINKSDREYTVTMEKIHEDTNLIHEHFKNRMAEISAMEEKVNSLLKLKEISDELSLSLSSDEIIQIATQRTFDKFRPDVRVLFYLKDEKGDGISLVDAVSADSRKQKGMKKGGIFERWVLKNMQSLLVRDVRKDYRFSLNEDEKNEDFISLMSEPLICEGNIIGVLRVDSRREEAFGQHDLRILDIIGELTAVALGNSRLYRRTEELALKDSLTGLYVYRYFMERLEEEVQRGLRSGNPFAMIMFDIDDFKKFNDKYGHIAGDIVLRNVGHVLKSKISAGDIVCRYGGEEFAFVALGYDIKKAAKLAEEIREDIENSPVTMRREEKNITVSAGVSVFPDDAKLREDLIWEADRRLYQAKAEGKNKICAK
ncbi:MAG: sensor domain-containing diguanylate cyclase [Candidatus Omnitrophica bacterium]|nr:sensor domain-containing diguanylate cyclase [Candidatus Omnitrophota bacterium]